MCGILFTNEPNVSKESFGAALHMMNHRGPDAYGLWTGKGNYLGQTRLKIIDLDNRSNQPFWSADGRFLLIFNGEIYNYKDLVRKYNIPQKTTSDTEIVIEMFSRFGARFLDCLNGMFALVILDTTTNEVFIARDRLGVKPLYICRRNGHLTVSSEIAPLLAITGIKKFDEIGLRQYRKLRSFFNGHTIYSGIEMFPAAHFQFNGLVKKYWQMPEYEQTPPNDEELREMIIESIKMRRIADVPVGAYLSGGLDSTIIAALAHEPHTWTVGFANNNEFDWGRIAAERIGSIHHEVLINEIEFIYLAREMIYKRQEPLSVPNEVLLYKMTKKVKEYNTVILSGEGADELFFGYDRIFRWAAQAKEWNLQEFSRLYAYGSHEDLEIIEDVLTPFLHLKKPIAIVAHFFQVAHLHGLLRRLDNSTMLCSVEARVPFVDHHLLIERMANVAFDYRMKNGEVKSPLKRIFQDIIPQSIIHRPKVGFPVPLNAINFGEDKRLPPMDQWLAFNLRILTQGFATFKDFFTTNKND